MNSRRELENIKLAIIASGLILFPNVDQVGGVILSGILFVLRWAPEAKRSVKIHIWNDLYE